MQASLLISAFWVAAFSISSTFSGKPPLPKISVKEILQVETHDFLKISNMSKEELVEYVREEGSDIIMGGNLMGLTLLCTAEYPITWKADTSYDYILGEDEYGYATSWMSRGGDLNKGTDAPWENWGYSAVIQFWGQASAEIRNYTCQATLNKDLKSSKYLVIEGYTANYLLYAGNTFNISIGLEARVTAPCKIMTTDVTGGIPIKLLKARTKNGTETWDEIGLNSSITFDPRRGYSLLLEDLPDILGWYKCVAENEDNNPADVVHFQIIDSTEPVFSKPEVHIHLEGSASVDFNYTSKEIQCCSNGNHPPELSIVYCFTKSECDMMKTFASSPKLRNKKWYRTTTTVNICSMIRTPIPYFWLKCEGEGVSVFELYSYSFRNSSEMEKGTLGRFYLSPFAGFYVYPTSKKHISDFSGDSLMSVTILRPFISGGGRRSYDNRLMHNQSSDKDTLFSGEKVKVYCHRNLHWYAVGGFWKVAWKNGTSKVFQHSGEDFGMSVLNLVATQLDLTMDPEMNAITCFIPELESGEWKSSTLSLIVHESEKPQVLHVEGSSQNDEIHFTLNATDQRLECNFWKGRPVPKIGWSKDGKILKSNDHFNISQEGLKSLLIFTGRLTHDKHGLYTCTGSSVAGSASKSFAVYVDGASSSAHVFIVTGLCIVVLVVIILGVALVIWKTKTQKTLIKNTIPTYKSAEEEE